MIDNINERLYEGMIAKNYIQLCGLLDEPIKTGKTKIRQIDNWKRYFEFERNGQSYAITKIYDTCLPQTQIIRGRGRPRKEKSEGETVVKRKRGRPKKECSQEENIAKRKVGRPRKERPQEEPIVKRRRGRPKKERSESEITIKRKKGRPRKELIPKEKKGRTGKFIKYIEPMILELLQRSGCNQIMISKTNLYEILGMVNPTYQKYIKCTYSHIDSYTFFDSLNITHLDTSQFGYIAISRLSSIFMSCLNSMSKRNIISYENTYCITEAINGKEIKRCANKMDITSIEIIQKNVFKLLKCKTIKDVYKDNKIENYFSEFQVSCFNEYGWITCYPVILITTTQNNFDKVYCNLDDSEGLTYQERKEALNHQIIETMYSSYQKVYDKSIKMIDDYYKENTDQNAEFPFEYPDDFVENGKYLCDCLLKI